MLRPLTTLSPYNAARMRRRAKSARDAAATTADVETR
jgi:hypothetical protein